VLGVFGRGVYIGEQFLQKRFATLLAAILNTKQIRYLMLVSALAA